MEKNDSIKGFSVLCFVIAWAISQSAILWNLFKITDYLINYRGLG